MRNKFYSAILTIGVAIGIASSLLLGMYTIHELSYDNFQHKKERIFLVAVDSKKVLKNRKANGQRHQQVRLMCNKIVERLQAQHFKYSVEHIRWKDLMQHRREKQTTSLTSCRNILRTMNRK